MPLEAAFADLGVLAVGQRFQTEGARFLVGFAGLGVESVGEGTRCNSEV